MLALCKKSPAQNLCQANPIVSKGNYYLIIDMISGTPNSKKLESGIGFELAEHPGMLYDSFLFQIVEDDEEVEEVVHNINCNTF